MMEAASSSETSESFDQTTRRNNPEDSHLHTRPRENLNSHNYQMSSKSLGARQTEIFGFNP
jgi:hypothetical protein